jgi:hypothetical protein
LVAALIFAAPYAVDLYNWLKTVYGKDRAAEVMRLQASAQHRSWLLLVPRGTVSLLDK